MATSIPPLPPPPATTTTATSLSSPTSTPSSSSNKEKANHTRLCRLLVDIGRQVLQGVFDRIYPPSKLNATLWSTSNQKILKKLKTKKIMFGKQWDTLFPMSGAVTSADFDITLLFLLLRNICRLKAPGTGWDNPPLVSDLSNGSDLVRIKICRNELYAHIVNAAIPDNEFQTLWDDIEAALLRLGGPSFQVQIQRVKYGALDEESELSFNVLTQCWEEGEKMTVLAVREGSAETLVAIRELHEKIDKGIISINGRVRLLTAGGLAVTWAAGSGYLLHRHRDDPETVIKLVQQAIVPSLFATGAVVHKLLSGSFKILVKIRTLDALDAIWKSYIDGDMKENLEQVIVTDKLRSLAPDDAKNVDISLEISEDDYGKTRDYLLECALRNYVEACKSSSASSEETSAITKHVKTVGLTVTDEYKAKSISYNPGKIEWKVVKELLTKATNLPVIRVNRITLEISDPIDAIAHALVETSGDLNVKDTQGTTLLIYSAITGAEKAVQLLVNAGADVNVTDERGRAPLIYAVETGILVVVQHPYVDDKTSLTAKMVSILIEAGAHVNAKDAKGKTALMYASNLPKFARYSYMDGVRKWATKVVEILIKAGADVKLKDREGKTALMYAVQSGNTDVQQVLKFAGDDIGDSGGYAAYGQSAAKVSKTGFLRGEKTGRQEYLYPMRTPLRTKRLKQKTEPTSSDLEFGPETSRLQVRKKTTGPTVYHPEKERHQVETAKEFKYNPFTTTFLQDDKLKESELTSYSPGKDLDQVKPAKRKRNLLEYAAYRQSATKVPTDVLRGEETGRQEYLYPMRTRLRTKGLKQKTEPTSSGKKTTGPTMYHPEKESDQVEAAKEFINGPIKTTFPLKIIILTIIIIFLFFYLFVTINIM